MNDLVVREVAFGSDEYRRACTVRDAVLRRPLGLVLSEQDRAGEDAHFHVCAFAAGELVGCLVLVPLSTTAVKMRQVAVLPRHQRAGIGTELVRSAERLSRERGARVMVLHARLEAVPFYERLGYSRQGESFSELGVPHFRMHKDL